MHVHVTSCMYILWYIQVCRMSFISLLPPQILLAYSDGNHYDSVYTKRHKSSTALCQGEQTIPLCLTDYERSQDKLSVCVHVCTYMIPH